MKYATISFELTYNGAMTQFFYGWGKERISVYGIAESFARMVAMLDVRRIEIIATDNKPDGAGLCFTMDQGKSIMQDMITTLVQDKNNKGRKVTYTFVLIDPYTCVELMTHNLTI